MVIVADLNMNLCLSVYCFPGLPNTLLAIKHYLTRSLQKAQSEKDILNIH